MLKFKFNYELLRNSDIYFVYVVAIITTTLIESKVHL